MNLQTRDLYCTDCDARVWDVACEYQRYPGCASCGGRMAITWEGGQAPATDVYGSAQYSDASGQWHTSQREKIKYMKNAGGKLNNATVTGFEEAGDKVGGARNDTRFKRTGYSFAGQRSHRTASEGA